jgi:hypothetical protein
MRPADWMLLSSIKPKYDHPSERFDGITLPGKLKEWFVKAGFGTVEDHTNLVFNKGLEILLQAQIDYQTGHTICLFVDADVFRTTGNKQGRSFTANHWVVMTSDIRIRKFDEGSAKLAKPVVINSALVKSIKTQIQSKQLEEIHNGYRNSNIETEDKVLLDAFSWGETYRPVLSRIAAHQDARLSYFLGSFYGYLKIKR